MGVTMSISAVKLTTLNACENSEPISDPLFNFAIRIAFEVKSGSGLTTKKLPSVDTSADLINNLTKYLNEKC